MTKEEKTDKSTTLRMGLLIQMQKVGGQGWVKN
jgi:hypothetical protein